MYQKPLRMSRLQVEAPAGRGQRTCMRRFWAVEKCQNCRKMSLVKKEEAGFTLIDLLFTASLICTLCTMALPSLMRARGVAQSASALSTVRVVNSSQLSFAVTCGSGFYAPDFVTLGIAPPNSLTAFL